MPTSAISTFRAAAEGGDHEALLATLAPDVRFFTPVYHSPMEDREVISTLLQVLLETFEDFHYTDELVGDDAHALVFRTTVGDYQLQGVDLLRPGDDGLFDEFTVLIRPLEGLDHLAQVVGAQMAERL